MSQNVVALSSNSKDNLSKLLTKIKKKANKKRTYESLLTKPSIRAGVERRIDECDKIPEPLKRRFKLLELDPLCLILTDLPFEVQAEELQQFFSTLLCSLLPELETSRELPVTSCWIGETKRFAVIITISAIACQRLERLHSVIYLDSKIFIQRPKGFFVRHFSQGSYELDETGVLRDRGGGEAIRLCLSGLPQYMTDIQVRRLVESMGQLRVFQMKTEFSMGESVSKGYCFLEYFESTNADKALKELDGLHVGDSVLKIQKVAAPVQTRPETRRVASTSESQTCYLLMFPKLRDPFVQATLSIPSHTTVPSRVIQILNMCDPEDLFENEFYETLMGDVREEIGTFGQIVKIIIPRPNQDTGLCCSSVGKVFIKLQYQLSAKQARYRINGRTYNYRTLVCTFFPESRFDKELF